MSVSIEKLVTFQDYSVKYDINSKGLKPSAYYDTLKWTFDNINDIKLTEERKKELLDNLMDYTDMRLLPQDLVDILSREDAVKITKLHDAVRKALGLKKEKVVEVKAKDVAPKKKKDKVKRPNKAAKALKDTGAELKKVTWPKFKEVVKQTGIVLVVVIVFAIVLFGFDRLCSWLTSFLH